MRPVVEISHNLIADPTTPTKYGLILGQYNGRKIFLEVFPESSGILTGTVISGKNQNWIFSNDLIIDMFAHNEIDTIDNSLINNPSVITKTMLNNIIHTVGLLMNKSPNEIYLATLAWMNQ